MTNEAKVLQRVLEEALGFFDELPDRPVAARTDVDGVAAALGQPLPDDGLDPIAVVEELIAGAEPGVVAMPSSRFFGWVIGGVLPAALAADWLTSTWDQNAGLLASSPAAAGAEQAASAWILELLGLPPESPGGLRRQRRRSGRRPAGDRDPRRGAARHHRRRPALPRPRRGPQRGGARGGRGPHPGGRTAGPGREVRAS